MCRISHPRAPAIPQCSTMSLEMSSSRGIGCPLKALPAEAETLFSRQLHTNMREGVEGSTREQAQLGCTAANIRLYPTPTTSPAHGRTC